MALTPVVSNTTPEVFFLQTTDVELRQVSRGLVREGGEWWRTKFPTPGDKVSFTLKPLREHLSLSVFSIDLPVAVLDAMLEMMHVPEAKKDYWRHLPPLLQGKMLLCTWRGYMREYGFTAIEDLNQADEDCVIVEPPAKKARIMTPYDEKLIRVAKSLHTWIFSEHPMAAKFVSGLIDQLFCHFMVSYSTTPSSVLQHDDLSGNEAVIGWYIGAYLNLKQREFFLDAIKSMCADGTSVRFGTHHERDEKSKSNLPATSHTWPLSQNGLDVSFSKQHHQVYFLAFSYRDD